MYRIYADDILIYDSTIDDYKIEKALITLEINKSGSFSFSLYPDHFFYDRFIKLKTVIIVYKSNKIVFRGRILSDVTDYWNHKNITCEGELGFFQDSIIRPYSLSGTPRQIFEKIVNEHNAQVDDFKKFKIGTVTISGSDIPFDNEDYESSFDNLNDLLDEDSLGGYLYITHGDDGTDPIPTINYLADFDKISAQKIEFGQNLKKYTKTVKAENLCTAIIPLGDTIDDSDTKLTIKAVNNDIDYVYDADGVALYGWIFQTIDYDGVTNASELKAKAETDLRKNMTQNITIELTAIDLHLLDKSIESFNFCEYVEVNSEPHRFKDTLLCKKQTIDILKPENDSLTLGHTYSTFTELNTKTTVSTVKAMSNYTTVNNRVNALTQTVISLSQSNNKVMYNNSGDCILISFTLNGIAFNSGENTSNISTYIPDNYELVSCIAQLVGTTNVVITAVSISGTNISLTGVSISTGYNVTATGFTVSYLCVCHKIEREEV